MRAVGARSLVVAERAVCKEKQSNTSYSNSAIQDIVACSLAQLRRSSIYILREGELNTTKTHLHSSARQAKVVTTKQIPTDRHYVACWKERWTGYSGAPPSGSMASLSAKEILELFKRLQESDLILSRRCQGMQSHCKPLQVGSLCRFHDSVEMF